MAAIWGGGHVAETSPIQGEKYKKQRQKNRKHIYKRHLHCVKIATDSTQSNYENLVTENLL